MRISSELISAWISTTCYSAIYINEKKSATSLLAKGTLLQNPVIETTTLLFKKSSLDKY
jgi:hypothetical protein